MPIFLDDEYRGCRIWDQWHNRDKIRQNDAKFKREALAKQGKKARRFGQKGVDDGVREGHEDASG